MTFSGITSGDRGTVKAGAYGVFLRAKPGYHTSHAHHYDCDLEGYSMLAIEQMTSGVAMTILTSVMMFFFSR